MNQLSTICDQRTDSFNTPIISDFPFHVSLHIPLLMNVFTICVLLCNIHIQGIPSHDSLYTSLLLHNRLCGLCNNTSIQLSFQFGNFKSVLINLRTLILYRLDQQSSQPIEPFHVLSGFFLVPFHGIPQIRNLFVLPLDECLE